MKKLGDSVKAVTELLGLEQCEPCKARQQWLNDLDTAFRRLLGSSYEEEKQRERE